MQFQIRKGVEIPPAAVAEGLSHKFPWGDMAPGDSFVVPSAYWTEERGISKEKATAENARNRVLNAFKTWQKRAGRRDIMLVTRTHKESGDVEVWLRSTLPAPTEPSLPHSAEPLPEKGDPLDAGKGNGKGKRSQKAAS